MKVSVGFMLGFIVPSFNFLIYTLLSVLFLLSTSVSTAETVLELDANALDKVINLSPYLEYVVDPQEQIQIAQLYDESQASDPLLHKFQPMKSNSVPSIRQAIWYKMTIHNLMPEDTAWVVNFDELLIDELLFYYQKDGHIERLQAGLNYSVNSWPIDYRYLAMPLTLKGSSKQTIYFRIKTSHIPLMSPTISSELAFATSASSSTIINLLFIGMGLGLCLFMAIFMPLAIASRESYTFISYLVLTTLVIISVSGFLQYLFPAHPQWHKFLLVALLATNSITNLLMVNTFFGIYRCNPLLNKLYWLSGFGFSVFIWGYSLFGGFEVLMVPLIGCTLFMFVLLMGTSILKYYQGSPHAVLFMIAKLLFFITCAYSTLGAEGIVPYNSLIRHGIGSGIILQAAIICLAAARKVNAEKAHASELEKNIAIAKASSREKSEFLATMSHEIRTPMNGVLGMAQMLEKTPLNPEQHRYTQVILNAGKTLLAVINDILDFSKIEAGKMQLVPRPFNLQSLINDTYTLFQPIAQEKQLDFRFHITEDCPLHLGGDAIRLQQILNNLLSNAFKFTESGFVQLDIALKYVEQQEVELLFTVKDSGIGISHDKQRQLFQAFTQAHRSTTRSYGGTGLGLAISKELVQLMRGEININSAENNGSEFWFTASFGLLSECDLQESSSFPSSEFNNECIDKKLSNGTRNDIVDKSPSVKPLLVAEDNPVNQQVIGAMLSRAGLNMTLAEDGDIALQLFQQQTKGFAAVLMDLEMPVKNGYQAASAIRNLEKARGDEKSIPIIALTAHVMEGNIKRCYDNGMDAVLKKPLQLPELLDTLQKLEVV